MYEVRRRKGRVREGESVAGCGEAEDARV